MFLLKFISSLGIFLTSTIIGHLYGQKFTSRYENLIYMNQCIKILETEIVYGSTPLPDALSNVYRKGKQKVSFIFKEIKEDLLINKPSDLSSSFLSVEDKMYRDLSFNKADVEMFLSLGRVLGTSDRLDQQKNIALVLNQMDGLISEARLEKTKNEKLYKSLGIITGIGIIILLI